MAKNVDERLGSNGDIDEVLAHPWLNSLDPKQILAKQVAAPMKP